MIPFTLALGLRAVENSNFIMKNNHPQHLISVREVAVAIGVCVSVVVVIGVRGRTVQQFTLEF